MPYDVQNFDADVLQRSYQMPLLVDFWAPWCGPCKMLGPLLERLEEQAEGRWGLVKVNTEKNPGLAAQFDIRSLPNVKLIYRGEIIDEFIGLLPQSEILAWISRTLPSPNATIIEEAQEMLNRGDVQQARTLLEPVHQSEPRNEKAVILLARSLLGQDTKSALDLVRGIPAESDSAEKARAIQILGRFLEAESHPSAFPEHPVKERFLASLRAFREGEMAGALEGFIQVLEKHPEYHGFAAMEAGKSIFQLLGFRHPICERYYRAFSSAIHR